MGAKIKYLTAKKLMLFMAGRSEYLTVTQISNSIGDASRDIVRVRLNYYIDLFDVEGGREKKYRINDDGCRFIENDYKRIDGKFIKLSRHFYTFTKNRCKAWQY